MGTLGAIQNEKCKIQKGKSDLSVLDSSLHRNDLISLNVIWHNNTQEKKKKLHN